LDLSPDRPVVTGGVFSPLFPSNLAAIPINLIQFGTSRSSNLSSAAILLAALAFLLAPLSWLGPVLPPAIYWLSLAISVSTTGFTTVYYRQLLVQVAEESAAATLATREALAAQAVARARDLEQLSAKISHELKNPLSAIKTLVQVSAHAATDPQSRERLEVVVREVRRIEATLRDYLSFSKPMDLFSPRSVSLAKVVDDTLALVEGRAREAKVSLERVGESVVEADAMRLSQALLNLVTNALEASSAGGSITVSVGVERGTRQAKLSVRDQGAGMSAETLARIGTPFFTTRGAGTGLGVILARACFEQHGGSLRYESTAGEGTVATALLPLLQRERSPDVADSGRR
jgi:signal transduction histidine kinase